MVAERAGPLQGTRGLRVGGVHRPITHQAPFGTMGTIHASDALKHERGVSRLKGRPGP